MFVCVCRGACRLLSNIILLVIMVGAIHAHVAQKDGKMAPAIIAFVLLGFRLMFATSFPSYALVDEEEKKKK